MYVVAYEIKYTMRNLTVMFVTAVCFLFLLTETCNLGLPRTSLPSMLWSIDTCQNKVSADQYHVTISRTQVYNSSFWSWSLTKCWFSIGSRAHVRLTLRQGRIVRKPANVSPGLKFIRNITVSSIQMFFAALFYVHKTQNRKPHRKVTKLKSKSVCHFLG